MSDFHPLVSKVGENQGDLALKELMVHVLSILSINQESKGLFSNLKTS